ncbi:hypothetical protein RUND412_001400 [Rhizina undulata]
MAPRQAPLTCSGSSSNLFSWPLEKYSYSVSPILSSSETPWTHFPHRDNVFLVIDKQRRASRLQQDGTFVAQQTRLKVIWGADTLEDLDLASLTHQKITGLTPAAPAQPAVMALGRSPCLAIKYINQDEGTFRRFQLRLISDDAFQAAKTVLEQVNCPVKMAGPRSSDQFSSQSHLFVLPSRHCTNLTQNTPRGYNEARFQSSEPSYGTPSHQRITPPPNLYYNPNIYSRSQNVTKSSRPEDPVSSKFSQLGMQQQTPPLSSHSSHFSYPGRLESPEAKVDESLPPPRPPPSLDAFKKPAPQHLQPEKSFLPTFPPLRKPTPVSKPHSLTSTAPPPTPRKLSMVSPGAAAIAYHTPPALPTPSRRPSRTTFGSGSLQQGLTTVEQTKAGTGGLQSLAGVAEYCRNDGVATSSVTENKLSALTNIIPDKPGTKTDSAKASKKITKEATNCGEKRKFQEDEIPIVKSDEKESQSEGKGSLTVKESENREFLELERLMVDAIHDDEFVKFVEKVSRVWQRAGFDTDAKRLNELGPKRLQTSA